MPEGDTLFRAATTLRKALLGRTVTRFESSVPGISVVDDRTPVAGRVVSAVEARGKHLLITFSRPSGDSSIPPTPNSQAPSPDLILHTHLRMTGSWHVYRPGEPWQKPERYAKVVIHTEAFIAPCFSAPVVELLTEWQVQRHTDLQELGPDAMTEEFDAEEARQRILRRPDVEIGVALMNQRLMAGVGNVYKSEVLFMLRVSPFSKVRDLAENVVEQLVAESHRYLRLNQDRGSRRTVFGLSDRDRLWAYGRSGEPCRVCGETIRMRRQGLDARSTYYCPRCQQTG